jgi:hypothetical protein
LLIEKDNVFVKGKRLKMSLNNPSFQDIPDEIDILPLDRTALEGLAYLAYETIGQLVDICLQVRHDQTTSDPILRQMVVKLSFKHSASRNFTNIYSN